MNKGVVSNNKGIMNNETHEIITNVLWIVAIVGMVGLLIMVNELKNEVHNIRYELTQLRK